jgi:hypothetical protein
MLARLSRPRPLLALGAMLGLVAIVLVIIGRPAICPCGPVRLWGEVGPAQSQMLADWYSLSHVVHGVLFYALLHLLAPRWPVERRFLAALVVEATWEVIENTPLVIDRYRDATIALGYSGDSILNSMSDVGMMALGFWAARRFPWWISVGAVLLLELVPLIAIRDNLALNLLMLVTPNEAVRGWQAS